MRLIAIAVFTLVPLTALAEDIDPVEESTEVVEPAVEPTDPDPWAPAVEPVVEPPVVPSPAPRRTVVVQPVVARVEVDPCGGGKHAWKARMKGRLALGFSKGHLELDDDTDAKQKSLLARVSHPRRPLWELELELSKLTIDGARTGTAGISLVKAFGSRKLRPYLIAGVGGGKIDRSREDHLRYAEFGGGLMFRKDRLGIGIDVRRGVRHVESDEPMDAARMTETPDPASDRERYVRGRILALVYF